jgi:hypothetical protein
MNLKRTPLIVVAGCAVWLAGCGMAQSQGNDPKKPGSPESAAQGSGAPAVPASPLQLNVDRVMVGQEFLVYVGGGAKLVPPTTRGNAESLPSISIFDGSTFLAGKIQSQDEKAAMIRITFTVTNPAQEAASFKIGDVALTVDSKRLDDFAAVGYNDVVCAMSSEDGKKVREIVVKIPGKGTTRLSYIFALGSPDSKQGTLQLGSSVSAPFEIGETPAQTRKR